MTNNTKANTSSKTEEEIVSELKTTSAKIRYFASIYTKKNKDDLPYSYVVKQLKKYNILTKEGNNISYQMVRNILLQPLTSK